MNCIHCGQPIEFYRVADHHRIDADHPYRAEYEAFGGWWIHSAGPARYLRICAFGETLADCMDAFFKLRDAKATPPTERVAETLPAQAIRPDCELLESPYSSIVMCDEEETLP